jgi:hypothetical protein
VSNDNDFDVADFNAGGNFVQKAELSVSGPRQVRIQGVEKRSGFKDAAGQSKPELVLIFTDGMKFGLRTRTNRDVLTEAFGQKTRGWVGQVIELFVDPSVRNPAGAKVGGVRIRIPAKDGAPLVDFTSDLEGDEDDLAKTEKVPF